MPGGLVAFARLASIDPVPDRGRFMSEVTRILLQNDPLRSPEILASRLKTARLKADDRRLSTDAVPVPLTAGWWSDHVFHRRVARDELVAAIASDRAASLVCHGLAALDDETLAFFDEHGAVVSRIVEKLAAPAFAAFSSNLHVHANRVVALPDEATPLWEAAVGEKMSRADRFIELLYELNDGRIAYLFDTIGQLDPPRRAFALGLWMPNTIQRTEQFRLLATAGLNVFREWHVRDMPLARSSYDLGMLLARVDATETGAPATTWARGFWTRAIAGRDAPAPDDEEPIDALWLVNTIGSVDVRQRGERQDQFAFAQRLASRIATVSERDRAEMQLAIHAFPRYRMLLATLERIGVRSPSTYGAAARVAARIATVDGRRGFLLLAQFQGALALIDRATAVRSIDAPTGEALAQALLAAPITDDGRYAGAVAAWLRESFLRAVPPAGDADAAVVAALAGGPSGDAPRAAMVTWEGQQYRLDLGASERRRLRDVRERQDALSLEAALAVARAGRQLGAEPATAAALQERLADLVERLPRRTRERDADSAVPGVPAALDYPEQLKKSIDDIAKAARAKDAKRMARAAESLVDVGDDMLAASLVSFAYAANVGDPEGTVLLGDDVSRRHNFGLGIRDTDVRQKTAWSTPREDVLPNVPWHVTGSLLGLDIALAPLALRRVNAEGVLEAPRLIAPERDAFALSVSLINPFALRDRDRDAIADAIARGTRRAQAMDTHTVDAIADEVGLDGSRRRALHWTLAHEPARATSFFTLSELLVLGGARPESFAAWGMAAAAPFGCFCTQLTTPARWMPMARRPQLGLTATVVGDLNLHVAVMLKQLQLPAALARVVLAAAAQDFIDSVKPTDPGDWLTLARSARSTPRERMEDYIAAATAAGPLIPLSAAQQ